MAKASKNIKRSFPTGKVGDMEPKALVNLLRSQVVQYEAQTESDQEGPGWGGAVYAALATLLSAGNETEVNGDTVFHQAINVAYQGTLVALYDAGLWGGTLRGGRVFNHPFTGRPITEG